jgi:CRISPR/Cas system-associated endonuclease Cas1
VRIATVDQGLDLTIGYLHASRPGRVALVYDLMEPLRPRADERVSDIVGSHTFAPSDFALSADGMCRLHPQLAREVARLAIRDVVVREVVTQVVATMEALTIRGNNHVQPSYVSKE